MARTTPVSGSNHSRPLPDPQATSATPAPTFGNFKPGDKVYYVWFRAAQSPYLQPIRVGVFVERDTESDPRWPKVRVHFGWISVESVDTADVYATEDAARAQVVALAKKHLRRLRAEVKRLASLDPKRINTQDRTGQIKKRVLAGIVGGSR